MKISDDAGNFKVVFKSWYSISMLFILTAQCIPGIIARATSEYRIYTHHKHLQGLIICRANVCVSIMRDAGLLNVYVYLNQPINKFSPI